MHTAKNDLVSMVSSASQRLYFNVTNKEGFSMPDVNYYHKLGIPECAKVKYETHAEDQGGGDNAISNITTASGEASGGDPVNGNDSTAAHHDGQQAASTATTMIAPRSINTTGQPQTLKRKRNLPGTPDPDSEVLALSPRTLMTTNRFVCEICNKGFQRDQNLQLHRRGHNLPWKLKQRSNKEVKKRVYVCPEPSCAHHDPSRALGDLTGIKKHYSRKHGEKKWKCEKCSKRYAVQSDWKAHSKTCGSREYRCDCGTLFSRRDSFITHRAFCDALAEESARVSASLQAAGNGYILGNGREQPVTMPGMGMGSIILTGSGGDQHLLSPLKTEGQNLFTSDDTTDTTAPPLLSSATSQPEHGLTVNYGANSNHRSNALLVPPMWWDSQMSGSKTALWGGFNKPLPPLQQYLSIPTSTINHTTNNSSFQVNQSPLKSNNNKLHNSFDSQDYDIHKHLATASQYNSLFTPTRTLLDFGVSPNWSHTNTITSPISSSTSAGIDGGIGNNNTSRAATSFLYDQSHELLQNSHSASMSATAMLQKAALVGATTTNPSLLRSMLGSNDRTISVSHCSDQTQRGTVSILMSHNQQRRSSTDFHTSTSEAVLSNSLCGQRNMIDNSTTMQGLMNTFSSEGWLGNHLIPRAVSTPQLHDEYKSAAALLQPSSSLREFDIPRDRPTLDFLGVEGRNLSQRERLANLGSRVDMQTAADITI